MSRDDRTDGVLASKPGPNVVYVIDQKGTRDYHCRVCYSPVWLPVIPLAGQFGLLATLDIRGHDHAHFF